MYYLKLHCFIENYIFQLNFNELQFFALPKTPGASYNIWCTAIIAKWSIYILVCTSYICVYFLSKKFTSLDNKKKNPVALKIAWIYITYRSGILLTRPRPRSPEWRMTTVRTSGSPRTPPMRHTQSLCLTPLLQSACTATPHTTATSAVKIGNNNLLGCKLCSWCSNVCVPLSPYLVFTLWKFLYPCKKYLQDKNKLLICKYLVSRLLIRFIIFCILTMLNKA